MALTAELYDLRKVQRCDRGGKFERVQCDDDGCFCVDIDSGDEISGTRTTDDIPNCAGVLNLCPRGEPFISQVGVVETCNSNDQCPSGHWCNQMGFSSSGLCCALPTRAAHSGVCPPTTPLLHNLTVCGFDCRSDGDCQTTEKCCYDGCGLRCKAMTSDVTESGEVTKTELVKPGQCPYFDERSCEDRLHLNQCGSDVECAGVQKCCSDGCTKKCLYPENASACVQAKSALQMIGQSERIQCRPDGSFEEVQCDSENCWCVNQLGAEVEGTRSSENIPPNCKVSCKYGRKKDSNGCDTCECSSPCDGVVCPDTSICVPMPVECISGPCPEVPRCVINPCLIGSPKIDTSTAQPVNCTDNSNCVGSSGSWYCSQYRSDNGVCCPGREPRWSPGTCPPATASTADCTRRCLIDEQCSAGQRCCFNGCGLSCVAAVFSAPPPQVIHIGECLETKPLGAFCVQRGKDHECSADVDCSPLRKCCSDGCTRRCAAPDITTHCIHARLAAMAIRESDSSVYVPECDGNGEYTPIQAHYGLKWCVDAIGREIQGTKTTHQPDCKSPRPCPVRTCGKHCPFGYRTNNDGCTVCDCILPCELVQCQAGFICRMVQPRCYAKSCPPIARCRYFSSDLWRSYGFLRKTSGYVMKTFAFSGLPNVCPVGEPLISPGADHLAECGEQQSCPTGYYCSHSGYEGKAFCCRGNAQFLIEYSADG
ncbi:WAP-type 'four-disulfide core [Cooperia oncophora]